ncbi:PilW family protein [Ideonella livida]|uniref:Prepilin-type N-terminal cleavage/methylation domain-containing protein n=1 Tax=Ideonella livida TaxID=2707176 RepID=A0A7C9TN03_9BURK|nr:PilW family protein [Ideonella livida]NDY92086.1 prepilin-type N-terminal cleavage/methylation domain-containing protein [Ideonella livida]
MKDLRTTPTVRPFARRQPRGRGARGLSLVELMVALAVGALVSVAVLGVLVEAEGRKRVTTRLNDLEQAGALALYQIDTLARSAGSGFTAVAGTGYGCVLHAKATSGQTLPLSAALPAPFENVDPDGSGQFLLAPVLILPGATAHPDASRPSDALLLMSGTAAAGGVATSVTAAPGTALSVPQTLTFHANELLLLHDPVAASCAVSQVASTFAGPPATSLPLGGDFHAATVGGLSLAGLGDKTQVLPLGVPAAGTSPQFLVLGVGAEQTLFAYDLLQTDGQDRALRALAAGVYAMHAVYGVDNDDDGRIDAWASPSSGTYAASGLVAGTTGLPAIFKRIKAIRVALVLRSLQPEKTVQSADSLHLFADLEPVGLNLLRTLDAAERHYRYRVVETTVVLRNPVGVS